MTRLYPVVILAGGLATRMRPLTQKLPKSLLEVAGKPFIDHQLAYLASQGIREAVLSVGFLGEMLEAHVGDGSRFGIQVSYSYDGSKLLGTGGAVKKAARNIQTPFFVLYGDSYLPIDWRSVQDTFDNSQGDGLMTVYQNKDLWDASNVVFKDGHVVVYDKFKKSPDMAFIDYGLEIFRPEVFEAWPVDEPFDLALVMSKLVAAGRMIGYEATHRFYEIGSHAGYGELDAILSKKPNT
jgi:N-acetyl-alpha-D-muramate 1-phosphate uridylyltransferase